jgi:carbon-monoxide dehydrogenase large subunit
MPYRTPVGQTYDSGEFAKVLDQALASADWAGFESRKRESQQRGRLRGRGLACYIEWTGAVLSETMEIRVEGSGRVTVYTGTQAMGQGTETSFSQLAAEVLQVDISRVQIVQGDTDQANGQGSVGSRSAFVGGSALAIASRKLIAQGKALAAEILEAAPDDISYADASFSIAGTDRRFGLFQVAARQPGGTLSVAVTESTGGASWPNGAQVCEVEIDLETGKVEVVRHVSVDDIGRIINRMIVTGQIQGGIAQGLGQALMEQAVYDQESGQLKTGSFSDYALPRASDVASMTPQFDEGVPCRTNLLGVKGVGEIGTIGAAPAVMNAVLDALAAYGVTNLEMPATAEKIWRATNGFCRTN